MADTKQREELLNDETVREKIAERAYFLSESHGFAPGREVEFWLTAEDEILSQLTSKNGGKPAVKKAAKATTTKATTTKATSEPAAEAPKDAKPAAAKSTSKATAKAKPAAEAPAKPATAKKSTKKTGA